MRLCLCIAAACFAGLAVYAGTNDSVPPAVKIAGIEALIVEKSAVVTNLNARMLAMDATIERKIGTMIDHLASVQDTPDSGTKIVRTKRDTIEALGRSITFYKTERAKLMGEMADSSSRQSTGDLVRTETNLDAHIERRVNQIVELSTSLMQHQDLQRYEAARDHGYTHAGHVRDVGAKTEEVKRELKSEFDDAIDRLDREVATLENALKTADTAGERAAIQAQLQNSKALLARRTAQRDKALAASSSPEAAVTAKGAEDISEKLDALATEIREDYRVMMQLNNERTRARTQLATLNKELARLKAAK